MHWCRRMGGESIAGLCPGPRVGSGRPLILFAIASFRDIAGWGRTLRVGQVLRKLVHFGLRSGRQSID